MIPSGKRTRLRWATNAESDSCGASILSNVTLSATVGSHTTTIDLQASDLTSAFSGWYYSSNQSGQGKYIHVAGTYPLP